MIRPLLAALAAPLLLTGCISLAPKSDPVALYRFGAATAAVDPASPAPRIGVLRAPTLFQREAAVDRILTVTNGQVAYLADSRWAAPAPVLFDQAVAAAFDATPGGVRLVGRGDPVPVRYNLRLDVRTFEARYERGPKQPPVVIVRLRAILVPTADRNRAVETLIEARAPAADNRLSAIVPAYDRAVAEALGQLTTWVGEEAAGS